MKGAEKSRLRGALKKLRALSWDSAGPAPEQEILDFLAMAAGIKPVWVAGRGGGDPKWGDRAVALARSMRFHITEGALWLAPDAFDGLPEWYASAASRQTAGLTAHYVSRARAAADAVQRLAGDGRVSVPEEAQLLGYPECCVADHYARARALHGTMHDIVVRAGDGDAARMAAMIGNSDVMTHAAPAERVRIATAMSLIPTPFTSLNMCENCADSADSPAARLSRRYAELALDIDRALYEALAED